MSFHSILSGLAACIFCVLLATICVRAKARALVERAPASQDSIARTTLKNHRQGTRPALTLAACAALAAFLGIPPGSLPALFPASWSALAALGCLALAAAFEGEWKWTGEAGRKTRLLAFLSLSLLLFDCYARQRGIPGETLSLDSYVATPLAGIAGTRERIGMLLLGLAVLLAIHDVQRDLASGLLRLADFAPEEARAAIVLALVRQIWILAALGVAACLFMPFCPAEALGMSGLAGAAADALFFWLKLLLADHLLWIAQSRQAWPRGLPAWAQALLAAGGASMFFIP